VEKGFLFAEDRVVPISLVASATEDRVTLRPDAGDLDKLPVFEETYYVPLADEETNAASYPVGYAAPFYAYPPLGSWMGYSMGAPAFYPPRLIEVERNIPEDVVPLREGARVISSDGQHVGNVERVFTETGGDRATGFLVSQGLILKERKLVPANWVREITEDEIYLTVSAHQLDRVRTYQE
jgi:hypothetical protein